MSTVLPSPKRYLGTPRLSWQDLALAGSSGALLAAAYVFPSLYLLAWVGLVPLLVALRHANLRDSYVLGAVAGFALYAGATHWVAEFVAALKGYGSGRSLLVALLFWVYSAQTLGLVALLHTWLKRVTAVPALFLFPLVFVAVCIAFPTLFTTRLGETQSRFLPAIQAIEFTGLYGLDFLVALVNAMLHAWVAPRAERPRPAAAALAATIVLAWFGYGLYAVPAWRQTVASWDTIRIGIAQPNEPPSIGIPPPRPGYSRAYPIELEMTRRLAQAGADVVIWPEARWRGYFADAHVRRAFERAAAALATPLVFHDQHRLYGEGAVTEYNTAVFLDERGRPAGTYRKRQRIAFGEYLPLVAAVPAVREWLLDYFAFDEIAPGEEPAAFDVGRATLVPLICYEVAFPIHVAESLGNEPTGKMAVALSNDSWFGATRQPLIHAYTSALRAVENRVPLVHALNNGPSVVVAPDGRLLFESEFRAAAGYVVDVPYSPRSGGSLFSRHPYWFIAALYVALALALVRGTSHALRRRGALAGRA